MRLLVSTALALLVAAPASGQRANVVPTDPLSPADERKSFTVPPGFEVQLVASEPEIEKPIQSAFDAKGRLWVTTTRHYPFAAEIGKGTDKLFVLSDFGPDGKARKVQTFADDLNIPIGVLPLPDCKSCLVFSIPGIWKYTDTDGDGKADKKELLFTGFGYKDTHGMVNSFTLMPDGWVYATHGFSNTSTVKGKDGHEITMQSGSTFRFRIDGSRIEAFTRGQVNPFGIAVDPWFNLYTADCHSKPITQLIRGATYQSFSKPHDGLGYAPHVTRHDHGSTALCGLTWYDADHFPPEYRGNMFLGNVVTNRINSDAIEWKGSTPEAKEKPDFLASTDGWFRPVDIKLGPDGALYVTDFYNKIIGHYEVDLKHPQRDKDRGRVWRIVWKGLDGKAKPPEMAFGDLTAEKYEKVDELLGHPNLMVRMMATHELARREEKVKVRERNSQEYTAHRLWVEEGPQSGGVQDAQRAGYDPKKMPLVAAHEARIVTAAREWQRQYGMADHLNHKKLDLPELPPQVARAAVDSMAALPEAINVPSLVALLKTVPAEDTHLKYAARVALRNSLMAEGGWKAAEESKDPKIIADVARGAPSPKAAEFLSKLYGTDASDAVAEFVGRYGIERDYERIFGSGSGIEPRMERDLRRLVSLLRGAQASGHRPDLLLSNDGLRSIRLTLEQVANPTAAGHALQALGLILAMKGYDSTLRSSSMAAPKWIARWMTTPSVPVEVRTEAFQIAVRYFPAEMADDIGRTLSIKNVPAPMLEKLAAALADSPGALSQRGVRTAVGEVMKGAAYKVALSLGASLASSRDGADALFTAIKVGQAPARLLQEKPILDRLRAAEVPDLDKRVAELTKGIPPAEQRINDLIKQRAKAFDKARPDKALGALLYAKHCAACHQIGGQGGKVGPNLDGIGARGSERLLEDILDPSRNVDGAFRARLLNLADGRTLTGLVLRVDGKVVVMADAEGKELRIPEADIEKNTATNLSPMPANFDATLPEKDFYHLLAFLVDQRPKDK